MNYYNKYIEYKNKYIFLKNYKHLQNKINLLHDMYGGSDEDYELYLIHFEDDINKIKIEFNYSNIHYFYTLIKNFTITIYNKINNIEKKILLTYDNFYINNNFFCDYLNINDNDNIYFNFEKEKMQIYESDDDNYKLTKQTLFEKSFDDYTFGNCEKIIIKNKYLKITDKSNVKTFIESYFRKCMCIMLQNTPIFTELSKYHNILDLYIKLCIINQYNRIEFIRHYNNENINILKKIDEIYKHIPKYIESNTDLNKIKFIINNNYVKLKDNDNIKILFDTGNSAISLVSKKLLQKLGYYNNDIINKLFINKLIFPGFYKPSINGIGGIMQNSISNLFLIKFKFTDPKLRNDKIYNIYAFEGETKIDLLLSQYTISQLYEDGYSIKWLYHIKNQEGMKQKEKLIKNYDLIKDNQHIINKIINESNINYINDDNIDDIFNLICAFTIGKYIENYDAKFINKIKLIIKKFYFIYKKQKETNFGLKETANIIMQNNKLSESILDQIYL